MSVAFVGDVLRWARERPRVWLALAFASWWLWTGVWVTGNWRSHDVMVGSAATLVVLGAAAVALAHRCHRLVTAALVLSPALAMPTIWAGDAVLSYLRGEAGVWVGGRGSGPVPYGGIDRDTRIPLMHWGCLPPVHAPFHNGVLRALAWFAPAPNTFQGALPTARDVRHALAASGEELRPFCRGALAARARLGAKELPCSWYRVSEFGESFGQRIVDLGEGLVAFEVARRLDLQEHPKGCASPGARCPVIVVHRASNTVLGSPPTHRDLARSWQDEDRRRRGLPAPTGFAWDQPSFER